MQHNSQRKVLARLQSVASFTLLGIVLCGATLGEMDVAFDVRLPGALLGGLYGVWYAFLSQEPYLP